MQNGRVIKWLIMDVDGTLTDGKLYIGGKGEIYKVFSVRDGVGIVSMAIPNEIEPVVITGRTSEIVTERCDELRIRHVYQGINNKLEVIEHICSDLSRVAYIGDDINDLEAMEAINVGGGIVGCPNNASDEIKKISQYVAVSNGGEGAVREFIEYLLNI